MDKNLIRDTRIMLIEASIFIENIVGSNNLEPHHIDMIKACDDAVSILKDKESK